MAAMSKSKRLVAIALAAIATIFLIAYVAAKSQSGTEYYFLALSPTTSSEKAEKQAISARLRGGAGYIYETGGKSYVILMGYAEKDNATKVSETILEKSTVLALKINCDRLDLAEKLYDGMIALEKEGRCKYARECILYVAKGLAKSDSGLYNLAMKTYSYSLSDLHFGMKYLYIALLLAK